VATELISTITDEEILEQLKAGSEGMVPLEAEDIAEAVHYALTAPARVDVEEVLVMPTTQQG